MIERETIVYVVVPKPEQSVPALPTATKPESSAVPALLFFSALAVVLALVVAFGMGKTYEKLHPSNRSIAPTPAGTPGSPITFK